MSRCRNHHAFMDEPCSQTPPAPADVGWGVGGGGERKWRLAAIFQEADVYDGREMKTESICCRVAVTAACVRVPLGELGMRLRSGPNMHCRTYPADKGEARCFYSEPTPSPSVP